MNILKATKRTITSTGQINKLRSDGFIPAILYGGKKNNLSISLKKLHLQDLIRTKTFMSKVVDLEIDGNTEKVLPKEVAYDSVSDEPLHIDFMRIVKGASLILEIPVQFINSEKSPGLKKGGVLNIVRRKVKLKCLAENIPNEIVIDLDNTEINTSFKISSVKLPENVTPTITDRDFVIATVVAPTILVEPEKTEEVVAEGEVPAEGTVEEMLLKPKKVRIKQLNLLMKKQKLLQVTKTKPLNLLIIKQKLPQVTRAKLQAKKLKKNNIG